MPYLQASISFVVYLLMVTFFKERPDFPLLIGFYSILFALYLIISLKTTLRFWQLILFAVLFRLPFLLSDPVLSDDVYRFIWDGTLTLQGENPYLYLPSEYAGGMPAGLLEKLNSPDYYSVYPALNQYMFAGAVWLGKGTIAGSILAFRLLLLAFSITGLVFFRKLMYKTGHSEAGLYLKLYAFNPLIILETIGNIHFEEVMVVLLLIAWFIYLKTKSVCFSGVFFAMACSVKLLPLMLLPLIWKKLGLEKGFIFVSIVAVSFALLSIPLLSAEVITHFLNSVDLYFHKFEFNASLYYLIRWLGFTLAGFNIIQVAGTALALLSLVLILSLSLKQRELAKSSLFIFSVYLLCSTTVHPWYLITPLIFSFFTPYRYLLVWSFTVIFSYSAYTTSGVEENMLFLMLEYLPVIGAFIWEMNRQKALKA